MPIHIVAGASKSITTSLLCHQNCVSGRAAYHTIAAGITPGDFTKPALDSSQYTPSYTTATLRPTAVGKHKKISHKNIWRRQCFLGAGLFVVRVAESSLLSSYSYRCQATSIFSAAKG